MSWGCQGGAPPLSKRESARSGASPPNAILLRFYGVGGLGGVPLLGSLAFAGAGRPLIVWNTTIHEVSGPAAGWHAAGGRPAPLRGARPRVSADIGLYARPA